MVFLTATKAYDGISYFDLVIESVTEQFDVKKEVFAKLDAVLR